MLFSTHVIAHAERLCERIAILARGAGALHRHRRRGARPAAPAGAAVGARRGGLLAADAAGRRRETEGLWTFALPDGGIEPLLAALMASGARIETLSIERPSLHEAFVAIVGDDGARHALDDAA